MIEEITSTNNKTVKEVVKLQQKKYREESKLFLVEGEKAINGLFSSGYEIEKLFLTDEVKEKFSNINTKKYVVNNAVISKISTTKTACNCVAVAKQKEYSLKDFSGMKRILLLENIKDAGNLGTIMRSCKAFDVEGVLLLGDTIDIYNPKVIRASVGCFDLPKINLTVQDIKFFKSHKIYSTALHTNSVPLQKVEFKEPCILAFGAEADGLSNEFLKNDTQNITIETSDNVESLNLATAVSICLYKLFIK